MRSISWFFILFSNAWAIVPKTFRLGGDPPLANATVVTNTSLPVSSNANLSISAYEALRKLKTDMHGFVHIADDGVARSYSGNDSVIDAVRLTNQQLFTLTQNLPSWYEPVRLHLHQVFANISGIDVEQRSLLYPPLARMPARLQNITGYTNQEFSKAVATAKGYRVPRDTVSPNPWWQVKTSLQKRILECWEIWCVTNFDCNLWGYCGACIPLDMIASVSGGICASF